MCGKYCIAIVISFVICLGCCSKVCGSDKALAEVIPLQYTDLDYENGIARAGANKGSLPGPGILFLSWDKKRPIPFQKNDILVFAKTGAATIVHIATMQNPTTISLFVSVNKPLDPQGDGFPNPVTIVFTR